MSFKSNFDAQTRMLSRGGEWLAIMRTFIQFRAPNGSSVQWGSDSVVQLSCTVSEMEELAARVADAAAEQETRDLRKQLAVANKKAAILDEYLNSRQCRDHSGKWERGRCLQCEIETLRSCLRDAITRMDRARSLLHKGHGSNWTVLDSADLRRKLSAAEIGQFLADESGTGVPTT